MASDIGKPNGGVELFHGVALSLVLNRPLSPSAPASASRRPGTEFLTVALG